MTAVPPTTIALEGAQSLQRTQRRGLRWVDRLTLLGIGLVVVLVSIPRVRAFAVHSNQADARAMLVTLGERVLGAEHAPLEEVVASDGALERKLQDGRWLAAAGVLLHHGYLFRHLRLPDGSYVLAAWPWHAGRTGTAAFALDAERELWVHDNAHGRWSGLGRWPAAPGPSLAGAGWRKLRKP